MYVIVGFTDFDYLLVELRFEAVCKLQKVESSLKYTDSRMGFIKLEQYPFLFFVFWVESNSVLPDEIKSDRGPAEKRGRFTESVFDHCCCEPQTRHIVT